MAVVTGVGVSVGAAVSAGRSGSIATILRDDENEAVIHVISDAVAASEIIVDVSALSGAPSSVRIAEIWYATNGAATANYELEWDAAANTIAWVLPASESDFLNFADKKFGGYMDSGGLINTASSPTGDINLTSINFTVGDSLSLVLRLLK